MVAFSLVELVLVVALLAVIAAITVPRFGGGLLDQSAVSAAAREMAADLRLCRSHAVSNAAVSSAGYALRMKGSEPYGGYEIVDLSTGAAVGDKSIRASVTCMGDAEFRFGPLGNLLAGSGTDLTLSGDGRQYVLRLTAATGGLKVEEL
jgi:Tfp pilus assembly protein PilE